MAVRLLVLEQLEPKEAAARSGVKTRQLRQRKERGLALLRSELEPWSQSLVGVG